MGHLLEEAVESFRRQTYLNKELVILNDCKSQKLECDVIGVRVLNVHHRYQTLGAKFNAMVVMASGDLLMPWEDDDISLPHRIEQAVGKIYGTEYWNPQRSWFWDDRGLHSDHQHGVCHNASVFTPDAWFRSGMYPETSGNQDAEMDRRLRGYCKALNPPLEDTRDWSYLYRWGVSDCHLSGNHHHQRFWDEWGKKPIVEGEFKIRPQWHMPYDKLCLERCKEVAA